MILNLWFHYLYILLPLNVFRPFSLNNLNIFEDLITRYFSTLQFNLIINFYFKLIGSKLVFKGLLDLLHQKFKLVLYGVCDLFCNHYRNTYHIIYNGIQLYWYDAKDIEILVILFNLGYQYLFSLKIILSFILFIPHISFISKLFVYFLILIQLDILFPFIYF